MSARILRWRHEAWHERWRLRRSHWQRLIMHYPLPLQERVLRRESPLCNGAMTDFCPRFQRILHPYHLVSKKLAIHAANG